MLIYTFKGTIAEVECPHCNIGTIRGYLGQKARCNTCGYGLRLGKQRKRDGWISLPHHYHDRRDVYS